MKINKINSAAKSLGFQLGASKRGRPGVGEMHQVECRNLLMLAIYESGRDGKGPKNYGGSVTQGALMGIFEIGSTPVFLALKSARILAAAQPARYTQIKSML